MGKFSAKRLLYTAEMGSYLCSMSATEQFYIYLKEMQETARKIKPTPKAVLDKSELPKGSVKQDTEASSKRDDNCLL
jgi:hypothetical protein